jgi:uncharacterized membrane protein
MKLRELSSIYRLRPVLIVCGIVSAIIILPLGIASALIPTTSILLALNAVLAISLLSVTVFSCVYGYKLLKMLKNLMQPKEEYIRKVPFFIRCHGNHDRSQPLF